MEQTATSFGFTAIIVRANAAPVAGTVTIGTANVVRVANGVAKAVVLIRASGLARSGTAIIEAEQRQSAGFEKPTLRTRRAGFFLSCPAMAGLLVLQLPVRGSFSRVLYDFVGPICFTLARPLSQP
jgi:hypothetical protein